MNSTYSPRFRSKTREEALCEYPKVITAYRLALDFLTKLCQIQQQFYETQDLEKRKATVEELEQILQKLDFLMYHYSLNSEALEVLREHYENTLDTLFEKNVQQKEAEEEEFFDNLFQPKNQHKHEHTL